MQALVVTAETKVENTAAGWETGLREDVMKDVSSTLCLLDHADPSIIIK